MNNGKIESISTIKFVYPFIFDPNLFSEIKGNIFIKDFSVDSKDKNKSLENNGKILVWEKDDTFPRDDLIRHVSKYINPEEDIEATAWFLRLSNEFLNSPKYLGSKCEWYLLMQDKKEILDEKIPFQISNIQLALFISGIGLLCIEACPKTEDINTWLDFLHYFRFFKGNRAKRIFIQRKIGFDKEKREPILTPFFPPLAGGLEDHSDGTGRFGEIIDMLLSTIFSDSKNWWDDIYIYGQMLPYANIFVKNLNDDKAYFIYKIRNFFHSKQQIYPAAQDLDLSHPNNLHYTHNSLFTFSLDGGAFIYFDAPETPFFRQTLPDHLKAHYFFLFILALQQRFSLISMSYLVSKYAVEKDEKKKLKIFEQIRESLIIFTARCLFTQIFQRIHHHRCYLKWHQTFQIPLLYQEVRDEVQDMYSYQQERLAQEEEKRDKELEKRINILVLGIGIPSLIFTLLDINITGLTSEGISLWKVLTIGILGSAIFSLLITKFILRKK